MKTAAIEIEDKVNQLLAVLDNDIRHIQDNLSRLNELRGFIVKRNDASLQKLLENIRSESGGYRENELKRQSLRKELAAALGCDFRQMTLSRLETELPEETKSQVARKRTELKTLAEKLKNEHLSTVMLLSDCARFNSTLLKSVLELGQTGTITYSSRGFARRQDDSAFMNLQL
ncbi:MAG: hypothetical protein CVV39_01090 [Planctomycetes bacterium HGW-Planctomycetes-1]|nr:MAG: hypothetical protein CVV39_01090 [Planctomycetes bacterium HGW-Planctomycetes-1]